MSFCCFNKLQKVPPNFVSNREINQISWFHSMPEHTVFVCFCIWLKNLAWLAFKFVLSKIQCLKIVKNTREKSNKIQTAVDWNYWKNLNFRNLKQEIPISGFQDNFFLGRIYIKKSGGSWQIQESSQVCNVIILGCLKFSLFATFEFPATFIWKILSYINPPNDFW